MPGSRPPAIAILGPTAAGKSDLALRLCQDLPCEIVSVDSAQIYRGMDIGTAKPDRRTQRQIRHHLIDIRDPSEVYSAARFRDDALRAMEEITTAGKIPLLVGGTMLYFRTLQRGISRLPGADPAVREQLEAEAARLGWPALHARLAGIDPDAAHRIHPNDPQRIQRALEVHMLTGSTLSEHYRLQQREPFPYRLLKIAVAPRRREVLHRRIEQRFNRMVQQGFIEEVQCLRQRGDLGPELPALRAVGYRQIWRYLAGDYDYQEMVQHSIIATRQLAKRQLTWLRAEEEIHWLESSSGEIYPALLKLLAADAIYAK